MSGFFVTAERDFGSTNQVQCNVEQSIDRDCSMIARYQFQSVLDGRLPHERVVHRAAGDSRPGEPARTLFGAPCLKEARLREIVLEDAHHLRERAAPNPATS